MDPYEEGRKACRDGIKHKRCPYKDIKPEVFARVDWLRGNADQARDEAREAFLEAMKRKSFSFKAAMNEE